MPTTRLRDDLLGTVITLSVYGPGAEEALDEMIARVEAVDRSMSIHRPDSLLSLAAERAGKDVMQIDHDTGRVLEIALEANRLSGGAFNPAIGPLVRLWGIGTENAAIPSDTDIQNALALTDTGDILFEKLWLHLKQPGMLVDLGGVAKGYACDAAVEVLRERGVESALLDLGGNIYAHGIKPDGSLWRVGVRSPILGEHSVIGLIELSDTAAVTSGGYERYFEAEGKLYHHILDPVTGKPSDSGLLSVTIVCANSAWADALSTSCFVLGLEGGQALIAEVQRLHPEIGLRGAVFIGKDNTISIFGDLPFELRDSRFRVMA